ISRRIMQKSFSKSAEIETVASTGRTARAAGRLDLPASPRASTYVRVSPVPGLATLAREDAKGRLERQTSAEGANGSRLSGFAFGRDDLREGGDASPPYSRTGWPLCAESVAASASRC